VDIDGEYIVGVGGNYVIISFNTFLCNLSLFFVTMSGEEKVSIQMQDLRFSRR
jgi:hypothetical protein